MFRHAQASFMSDNYDQLSELGYHQSSVLGNHLVASGVRMDKIYVGPLKRHWQTFEKVKEAYQNQGIALPEPILLPELREHLGPQILRAVYNEVVAAHDILSEWHEKGLENAAAKRKYHLKIFHYFMELWAANDIKVEHPKHLQNWATFRGTVKRGLDKILADGERGQTIGAFTSGGTISAAMGHILGMTDEVRIIGLNGLVYNVSISEFLFTKDKLTLKAFNTIPHLTDKKLITYV